MDLLKALTVMASAYEKFSPKMKQPDDSANQLRAVLLQAVANKDVTVTEAVIHDVDKPVESVDTISSIESEPNMFDM